jgi:hypothetical protein
MINLEKEKESSVSLVDNIEDINNETNTKRNLLKNRCFCGKSNAEHDEIDEKRDRLLAERDLLLAEIKKVKVFIATERERYNSSQAETAILRARNDATEAEAAFQRARYNAAEAEIRSLKIKRVKSLVCFYLYYFLLGALCVSFWKILLFFLELCLPSLF